MIETLFRSSIKKRTSNLEVDIRFDELPIGSTEIIDYGKKQMVFQRTSWSSGEGSVVNTPYGKCFSNKANEYFECTNGKLFNFLDSTVDKEMVFEFIKLNNYSINYLFSSGDYTNKINGGWAFLERSTYVEFFITNSNGHYDRLYSNSYHQPLGNLNKYAIQLDATNNRIRVVDLITNSIGPWHTRFTTTETWARLFIGGKTYPSSPFLFKSLSIREGLTTF